MSISRTGGKIGFYQITTRDSASGVWALGEAEVARRDNIWPSNGDAYWESVALLLHMDGNNASQVFTDTSSSPKSITVNGNIQISTDQSKFGGASALLDGSGDSLAVYPANIGTADFVLEWWMRVPNGSASFHIFGAASAGKLDIAQGVGGTGILGIGRRGIAWDFTRTFPIVNNTWHYCVISRASGTMRVFLDGAICGAAGANANSLDMNTLIGATYNLATGYTGYLDEVRLTVGSARGFTGSTIPVPTTAFPEGL